MRPCGGVGGAGGPHRWAVVSDVHGVPIMVVCDRRRCGVSLPVARELEDEPTNPGTVVMDGPAARSGSGTVRKPGPPPVPGADYVNPSRAVDRAPERDPDTEDTQKFQLPDYPEGSWADLLDKRSDEK